MDRGHRHSWVTVSAAEVERNSRCSTWNERGALEALADVPLEKRAGIPNRRELQLGRFFEDATGVFGKEL
jgi:hypothetical protein